MDDIRFKLGFWDVVIQRENLWVFKAIAGIIIAGLLCLTVVFVCNYSRERAVAAEKNISASAAAFIDDYSTLNVDLEDAKAVFDEASDSVNNK